MLGSRRGATLAILRWWLARNRAITREIVEMQVFSSRQEQSDYYRRLEEELTVLLEALAECTAPTQLKESRQYVEHGEYGLALEALCESIGEEQVSLPPATCAAIESLGRTMGLDSSTWEGLHTLVAPS